jgi:hypothetical protein
MNMTFNHSSEFLTSTADERISFFTTAACEGDVEKMDRLALQNQGILQEMVKADNYHAFRWAAANGHLTVIDRLVEFSPKDIQDMVKADNYHAFRIAAENGYLAVIDRLIKLEPGSIQDMINADDFYAFRSAVTEGHLAIVKRLIELAANSYQDMINSNEFDAFRSAAAHGRLDVMNYFIELAPDSVMDMVKSNQFEAFLWAAYVGNLDVMNRLIEISPDNVQDMVEAQNFYAFREAAGRKNLATIKRLLSFSSVFAYAEMHQAEYQDIVQDFIDGQLLKLVQDMYDFHSNEPNEVFDIADIEQAKLYFYMIRSLIRQETEQSLKKIDLLLTIPAVIDLAHQEVTPEQPNELLRLAMSLHHEEATQRLLNIPAVLELFQSDYFYQDEQTNGLDLRTLAQDNESSMHALSQEEQSALAGIQNKYQAQLDAQGVLCIMNELKNLLRARYHQHPAIVRTGDGREIELPMDYHAYQELAKTLSADTQERALQSYYQHQNHTAYRFLSKPNRWMSDEANYVNQCEDGACSAFEDYQELMSLLYLAAKDENTPAIEEYSIESRIDNFIRELADIGRAHNWDNTRIHSSKGDSEEYDDLEGDKPSCYSGIKRRLFQALKGHPLMIIVTQDLIYQEARDMVREHFRNAINDTNFEVLETACQLVIENPTERQHALEQLDFSKEQVQSMLDKLREKYGLRFNNALQASFLKLIDCQKNPQGFTQRKGFQFGLVDILKEKKPKKRAHHLSNEEIRAARLRFFASQGIKDAFDDEPMLKKPKCGSV